ncbi:hypothetical protein E4T56_gene11614 [Termitomyces sp. T112]|nr:hypothetical protein E4T56_gene11614 [Termitomyces sp. T112]
MGEVTYYEHEWERQLAQMYLAPSDSSQASSDAKAQDMIRASSTSAGDTSTSSSPALVGFKGMENLPTELLCKVFWHCTSNYTPISTNGPSMPLILSQVSSQWRSVAMAFPWLWNEVVIDCGDWSNMPKLVKCAHYHLERSGDLPISIYTSGSIRPSSQGPADTNAIHQLVSPYASRIWHTTLAFPLDWLNNFLRNTASIEEVQSLESLKLVYHPTEGSGQLADNNLFIHAPKLRKVELEYASELGWRYLAQNTVHLPWSQIEELNFIHIVASPSYLQYMLVRCVTLEKCTLSIVKVAEEITNQFHFLIPHPPQLNHISLPSIKHLTLYNPKNFDYIKYLAGLRIHFPSLEHFGIASGGDPRNGRQWSHTQFKQFITEANVLLRSVSTPAHISDADIESIIGEVPSLVELDVSEGSSISETTVRLMLQGYLASQLEVLKCAVAPELLSNFLDMVESRFVPRKSKAKYRGFKKLVIRCPKDSDGYREVEERVEELQELGRDITVVDA